MNFPYHFENFWSETKSMLIIYPGGRKIQNEIGRVTMQKISCFKCKTAWEFEPPLGRREVCPSCASDAKVCLNCKFYDAGAYRECREPQASWVKDKTQGNFCGYFTPLTDQAAAGGADDPLVKLNQLFGNAKSEPTASDLNKADLQSEIDKFLKSRK
jgi:hypothetical protein